MLYIDVIKEKLADRNLKEVSKRTGIKYHALRRIMLGEGDKLSYMTIEKLANYLGVICHEAQ